MRKIPKVESNYIFLSSNISLYSLKNENYYPQVFLQECKYIEKEKTLIRYITDDL